MRARRIAKFDGSDPSAAPRASAMELSSSWSSAGLRGSSVSFAALGAVARSSNGTSGTARRTYDWRSSYISFLSYVVPSRRKLSGTKKNASQVYFTSASANG
ncbi:MAG: hypothetical protein U0414_40955 [Polyangiaceae bacterium]